MSKPLTAMNISAELFRIRALDSRSKVGLFSRPATRPSKSSSNPTGFRTELLFDRPLDKLIQRDPQHQRSPDGPFLKLGGKACVEGWEFCFGCASLKVSGLKAIDKKRLIS